MRAPQPTVTCPACGGQNSPVAVICTACGAAIAGSGTIGDPQANSVAGAPVPTGQRDLSGGLGAARGRLANLGPELASVLAEAVQRRAAHPRHALVQRRQQEMIERLRDRRNELAERFGMLPLPPRPPQAAMVPARAARYDMAPPLPARALWFLLVGIWLSCLWVLATWASLCLVAFDQASTRMLTLIPTMLTLRPAHNPPRSIVPYVPRYPARIDMTTRIAYVLLVGWWASLIWMLMAYAISITVIGIPLGYRMYALAPIVAHLPES